MRAYLRRALALFALALACALTGCLYHGLPPANFPSVQRLRIVAPAPENYRIQADWDPVEHPVPKDGTLNLQVPGYRDPCKVYLFNVIRVGGGPGRSRSWKVRVKSPKKTVREGGPPFLPKRNSQDKHNVSIWGAPPFAGLRLLRNY